MNYSSNKKKLSIIIPVYNVEQYLRQCLQSIIEQIDESVELLIVNDGSPDQSSIIIDDFKALSPHNVVVINQQNQGLSMARNNGLDKATGEYVWFVDSDDWIKGDAIIRVKEAISKNPNTDVFSSLLAYYYEEDKRIVEKMYEGPVSMASVEYLKKKLPEGASVRFIYKRKFLVDNNLHFVPGLLHEDAIWGYMVLYKAKQVSVIANPIYVYRVRTANSIMSSISVRSAMDLIKGHKLLINWMDENVRPDDKKLFRYLVSGLIKSLLDFCKYLTKSREYKEFMKENKKYIMKQAFSAYRCSLNDFSLLTIAFSPDFFTTLCKIRVYFKKNYA